ncbi:MAG TPA: serine/threonine-protein kinase [Solirubrobacteraceae bacterium]|nr:serine/threonine-protein kinase [Solirubrobacteraceae bacterium]
MCAQSVDIGTRLNGRWEITGVLGGGGMAHVYRGVDLELGRRKAAIKVMHRKLARDPEFLARFERESIVAEQNFFHPHILPIWDSGDDAGVFFIAMPLADTDLASLLEDKGTLEPERALDLAGKIAWALDSAHENGVVHRDVKPENILLTRSEGEGDHPWLADFGIAKDAAAAATLTIHGMLGTAGYAAPEQIRGSRQIDGRADQYALACTLYDVLVGHPPFTDARLEDLKQSHLTRRPPPIAAEIGAPPALDDVFARALAKQPGKRYENCRAFVGAARRALDVSARGIAPEQRSITVLDSGPDPDAATQFDRAGTVDPETEYDRARAVDPAGETEYDPRPAHPAAGRVSDDGARRSLSDVAISGAVALAALAALYFVIARPILDGTDAPGNPVSQAQAERAALAPAVIRRANLPPGSIRLLRGCTLAGSEWRCTLQRSNALGFNCTASVSVPSLGDPEARVERANSDPDCRSEAP